MTRKVGGVARVPPAVPVVLGELLSVIDAGTPGCVETGVPTAQNVEGLFWLLYSVAIQSAERATEDMCISARYPCQ